MQPRRHENRSATPLAVMLTSLSRTELTLTENISSGGARVVTRKHWSLNDSLVIKSLEGDLQSEARVAYSQPTGENVHAIGLELIAPMGAWRTEEGRGS
jgi:hypothetical protein